MLLVEDNPDTLGVMARLLRRRGFSGFGTEEDLRRSRDAGFHDHLTKPIDVARLEAAIRLAAVS